MATTAGPRILILTREQLLYTLTEVAEIEHNLMCCYLCAAFTMKGGEEEGLATRQAEAVGRWRRRARRSPRLRGRSRARGRGSVRGWWT